MVAVVRVHKFGGPDALIFEQIDLAAPGPGQIRIKQHASGVNFIDIHYRSGHHSSPTGLPLVLGNEGAGEVTALGPDVTGFKVGDRIAYMSRFGSYAAERLLPVDRAVKLPESVSSEQAAGMMLKGMTARYLLRQSFKVENGHTILMHAAASGVGQILCQWANHLGAQVIGTVGTEEKAKIAQAAGCHHTILYDQEDFTVRVKEITDGALCDVVYDSVGKTTFPASLDCIRPRGTFVSFGHTSGSVDAFSLGLLAQKGSLFATRPTLVHHIAGRAELVESANDLFDVVKSGKVKISVNRKYALKDAQQAHRDLESRATTGSSILIP